MLNLFCNKACMQIMYVEKKIEECKNLQFNFITHTP
jgi:hypothetical protein